MDQENMPPSVVCGKATQVRTPAPSPPRPAAAGAAYPVRNTFIHYGTPLRAGARAVASPKTVPPNFAPEESLQFESVPQAVPEWPPSVAYQPTMMMMMMMPPAQAVDASRGAGIAPLRLFDFLPSPKVQSVPAGATLHPMAPMPFQMQVAQPPPMPFGSAFAPSDGAIGQPQLWTSASDLSRQRMPPHYVPEGYQPAWSNWGHPVVDYPPSMPSVQAPTALPASMPAPPLCPPNIGQLRGAPMEAPYGMQMPMMQQQHP